MKAILNSRKFWVFLVSSAISIATYFVSKYAGASAQDILVLIGFIEGLAGVVIVCIWGEDAAAYRAGVHPKQIEAMKLYGLIAPGVTHKSF
jgi:hypothetical protein